MEESTTSGEGASPLGPPLLLHPWPRTCSLLATLPLCHQASLPLASSRHSLERTLLALPSGSRQRDAPELGGQRPVSPPSYYRGSAAPLRLPLLTQHISPPQEGRLTSN